MDKRRGLHIICHDVPYPPDFGGVVDLFYKIKALHEQGIEIHLHCYTNKREPKAELERYCRSVNYYRRTTGMRSFSLSTPYIVQSRKDAQLLTDLFKDDLPVLMEGIHCTAFVNELLERDRKVFLRLHNVEHIYYRQLAAGERNLSRRSYFSFESRLLKKYERKLPHRLPVFAVSTTDADVYRNRLMKKDVRHLPVFIPFHNVTGIEGLGDFCLYHGNVSVPENDKAACWLIEKVFSQLSYPLVIAGKQPGTRLRSLASSSKNVKLVADPDENEMKELISSAQVNILPSFNNTGIKLKLIYALFMGRHCLVNEEAVRGSGVEGACHIANTAEAFASVITQLFRHPFTNDEIVLRQRLLQGMFDNSANARKLIQWIY